MPATRELDEQALALTLLRRTRGWSQKQLAARAGIDLGSVKAIEQGRRPRRKARTLAALAAALGLGLPALAELATDIRRLRSGRAAQPPPAPARDRGEPTAAELRAQVLRLVVGPTGSERPAAPGYRGGSDADRRDRGLALALLRKMRGLKQQELAATSGARYLSIAAIETGRRLAGRKTARPLATALGVDEATVAELASLVARVRAAGARQEPSPAAWPALRAPAVASAADLRAEILAVVLAGREGAGPPDRAAAWQYEGRRAAALWSRLSGQTAAERRAILRACPGLPMAAFCERLCEESLGVAGDSAARAAELAEEAVRLALLVEGDEGWRSRVEGYARVHLANAVRVAGRPRRARWLFERGAALWRTGAATDPGLLNEARVLSLEASLCRALRQVPEALALLDRALAIDRWGERPSLLIGKARALEETGEFEAAIPLLHEAASMLDARREPRRLFNARQNLLLNVCRLGRHAEAGKGLPEVRAMARRLGRLDLARVDWLEGKIAAGLGQRDAAIAALKRARREFRRQRIPYDTALVTLEMAEVHAAVGRTAEVKALALESAPIFREQGVHPEARRALAVFLRAAEEERATAKLLQELIAYLYRARHDRRLRFASARVS
jgi:transcriptional regulator with XRE-family HTH domain